VPPANGAWRIVQACRLIEKKGLSVSLRAFALLLKTHPQARLTIAGEGPLRSRLTEEASSLGISGHVDFVGFLDQTALLDLYRRSHIFVHPSETTLSGDREGLPNSMLEAMATGLPVVSTHHSGIPEAVVHGASGYLAPEKDDNAVYEGLLKLTANSAHWHALSTEASRSVQEKFELSRQIAVLENCYTEALQPN
jgi:colanic acid/amylovoran biosynthesis glycosyltransferase